MGLDMYLDKVKRINPEVEVKELNKIQDFLRWKSENTDYSLKEWCGVDESEINHDLVKEYESEFITRYSSWDEQKQYGRQSIFTEVAYWRKANQIHNWFVGNIQGGMDDCGSYEVTKADIIILLALCKTVKNNSELISGDIVNGYRYDNDGNRIPIIQEGKIIKDPIIARRLLPTTTGFFFGSKKYDEYYMNDIDYTIEVLEKILNETDFETEMLVYSSSW